MRIVFFDIDSLRSDHLGCYGYPRSTSPTIDTIAADGMRFDSYYCSTSPCLPSRAAWVTGTFGIRNGVVSNVGVGSRYRLEQIQHRKDGVYKGDIIRVPERMPRHLRRHGYDTITISNFADRHGADWFLYGWTEAHSVDLKGGREQATDVADRTIGWLRNNRGRDNFFLHVNFWDVHRCYTMDPSWAERFADQPVPVDWPDEATIRRHGEMTGLFTAHGQFPDDKSPFPLMPGAIESRADVEHLITGYDAAIAYVDHHIKLILDELEAQGMLEDTALIVSADHGDALGEHGIYGDHFCVDECVHRIPLIVRWPGLTDGGRESCGQMLYHTDFYPTLCELLEMPLPEKIDGESFAGVLAEGNVPDRDHLLWDSANYTIQRAVRTPTHLYIRTYDDAGYEFQSEELYAIANDPFQTRDLAGTEPASLAHCRACLAEWEKVQMNKADVHSDPLEAVLAERQAKR
ncbi:MAG: sulfatase [bacterium]